METANQDQQQHISERFGYKVFIYFVCLSFDKLHIAVMCEICTRLLLCNVKLTEVGHHKPYKQMHGN